MNLFDVLSKDERVIVLSVQQDKCIYTWNQSLTLQCWLLRQSGDWLECDIRTLSIEPQSWEKAREQAQKWHHDQLQKRKDER